MPFTATVLTMFPEAFPGPLGVSLIGTAWREKGLWSLETVDIPRLFHRYAAASWTTPLAGGGPGAVLKADVVARAVDSLPGPKRPLLYMSARGRPLTQARVKGMGQGRRDRRAVRSFRGGGSAGAGRTRVRGGLGRRRGSRRRRGGGDGRDRGVRKTDPRRARLRRQACRPKASRMGFWNIRSTRDRGRSRGWRYPRCCCRAITRRSLDGARRSGRRRRGSGGRTSGRRISPTPARLDLADLRGSPRQMTAKGRKARGEMT